VSTVWRSLWRLAVLLLLAVLVLQLYFLLRVALMIVIDPQSTTFQRSEIWRLATEQHEVLWSQDWVAYGLIGDPLKRAVIASEDANFSDHSGVEWDALEKAWERNQRAEARAEKFNDRIDQRLARAPASKAADSKPVLHAQPKLVGGSTITQQLAKNLFLGGERSLARKTQEFAITFMLEAILTKERILEIYLNNVEWGEGVFGAEAAARPTT
jgi:monofunctional biosynthetic peptidoglycan transglycosylase